MSSGVEPFFATLAACGCATPFGDARETLMALLAGRVAVQPRPVLGRDGGDPVPIALIGESHDETWPPRWLDVVRTFAATIPRADWGGSRRPVIVTSSNFGVGNLHAFTRERDARHLRVGPPFASVEALRKELGWGEDVTVFSHACVTAHLGLAHATRLLEAGHADEVLVLSFDLVSPFVAAGFHSLKILNGAMPAPFARREIGAIGLGDGLAYAVLTRERQAGRFRVGAHALHNEMHHFTGNQPDGAGFAACAQAVAAAVQRRRVWVKGHGTGTLEAGRLEAEAIARVFPGAPLVSWKGSLGHTLGSCGLVELAIAIAAIEHGRVPGTVGSARPTLSDTVALESFAAADFDAAVLASNAFGGAHAAMVLTWDEVARQPLDANVQPVSSAAESPAIELGPGGPLGRGRAVSASLPEGSRTIERFIHHIRVELPAPSETVAEARERLREKFPRPALRRMTHLGLLLGSVCDGLALGPDDAVVYASSFAETRALEDYLTSFPAASPLLFQTSIHPGGVQQVLIGRQQPIARLWPLAGKERAFEQALFAACLETAPRVVVLAGEERGTWLLEHGMASERAFAFALLLTREPAGSCGRVVFTAEVSADADPKQTAACPTLAVVADTIARREALTWRGANGTWSLAWT